jgi:predicted ArsR family transcriptional regulator
MTSEPDFKALVIAYLTKHTRGVTAGELAKYVGLTEGEMVQRLHDYEKDNKVVSFGREFHSGRDEPEPVWRLK